METRAVQGAPERSHHEGVSLIPRPPTPAPHGPRMPQPSVSDVYLGSWGSSASSSRQLQRTRHTTESESDRARPTTANEWIERARSARRRRSRRPAPYTIPRGLMHVGHPDQAFSHGRAFRRRSDPLISGRGTSRMPRGVVTENPTITTVPSAVSAATATVTATAPTTTTSSAVSTASTTSAMEATSPLNLERNADLLGSLANHLDSSDDRMFLRELERY